jgi:hypothetical protein
MDFTSSSMCLSLQIFPLPFVDLRKSKFTKLYPQCSQQIAYCLISPQPSTLICSCSLEQVFAGRSIETTVGRTGAGYICISLQMLFGRRRRLRRQLSRFIQGRSACKLDVFDDMKCVPAPISPEAEAQYFSNSHYALKHLIQYSSHDETHVLQHPYVSSWPSGPPLRPQGAPLQVSQIRRRTASWNKADC